MSESSGFNYTLAPSELAYLLFRKKVCPKCGGKMRRTKEYEITSDPKYTNMSPTSYTSMPGKSVKNYKFFFICNACETKFPLAELAKKKR